MPYTINKTNGAELATVADGTVNDTACNLVLIGRNVSTYGERQNENFVKLLENFSNVSAPSPGTALTGQLWYNSSTSQLNLRTANTWQGLATYNKSSATPSTDVSSGDLWYKTTDGQVYVYQGSSFRLIGPVAPYSMGQTQLIAETIYDTGNNPHTVLTFYIDNDGNGVGDRVAVISNDSQYDSNATPGYPGFGTIKPGVNLSTALTGAKFAGTATNSDALGGIGAAAFMRTSVDNNITANIVSSANITAHTINANLSGNGAAISSLTGANVVGAVASATLAATATALATARTITIAGNLSGSASFNGTSDITITTTLDTERLKLSGGTMTGQLNASQGFTAGTSSTANMIYAAAGGNVGIKNTSPQTALDVTGAVRSAVQVNATTSGTVTIDGSFNNHQINLTGAVSINITNFNQTGQIIRLILVGTNLHGVGWSSDVYWPNGVAPNLNNGTRGVAVVSLMRPSTPPASSAFILATYVSY